MFNNNPDRSLHLLSPTSNSRHLPRTRNRPSPAPLGTRRDPSPSMKKKIQSIPLTNSTSLVHILPPGLLSTVEHHPAVSVGASLTYLQALTGRPWAWAVLGWGSAAGAVRETITIRRNGGRLADELCRHRLLSWQGVCIRSIRSDSCSNGLVTRRRLNRCAGLEGHGQCLILLALYIMLPKPGLHLSDAFPVSTTHVMGNLYICLL